MGARRERERERQWPIQRQTYAAGRRLGVLLGKRGQKAVEFASPCIGQADAGQIRAHNALLMGPRHWRYDATDGKDLLRQLARPANLKWDHGDCTLFVFLLLQPPGRSVGEVRGNRTRQSATNNNKNKTVLSTTRNVGGELHTAALFGGAAHGTMHMELCVGGSPCSSIGHESPPAPQAAAAQHSA